ncbi:hypothetical protein Tco_1056383 [Tanacetum coccineum]|uniref:Uncharacterized protein n=1 Tax=Tanacetum coccineum TaxID=301880 RepID=A0ABQ5H2H1_9ASTR
MINNQRSLKDNHGLGFSEGISSTSKTKTEKLSHVDKETSTVEPVVPVPSAKEPVSSNVGNRPSVEDSEILEYNIVKRNSSIQITKKPLSNTSVRNVKQTSNLKLGQGLGRSKTKMPPKTSHRRTNTLYLKSDYHQVSWNYSTQQGYQFQPPNFGPWGSCPPYPYMNQPNDMYNANRPMRYWGPNA